MAGTAAPPFSADTSLISRYLSGGVVTASDPVMADALWLYAHPAWSQRDLDETDQDILDLMAAIDLAAAKRSSLRRSEAEGKARNAARRRR